MRIFARHIKSSIFLIFYALWWAYFFHWFTSGAANYPHSCGAANGALVMLTFLLFILFSGTLVVLVITNKRRADYLVFLLLVQAPILFIIGRSFFID